MTRTRWKILVVIIIVLIIITFTPLVTPSGQITPKLFGLPYTLWMGFLVTCLIVLASYLATKAHPLRFKENPEKND